jgi:hypothetical protein
MPRIDLIDVPLYRPVDPYHFEYDNLPLKAILRRQNLINLALDNVISQTRDAVGTQGSFANRLNQSLDPDGNLKVTAIDEALHSIGAHTDDDTFVRMLKEESDKLALIDDEANKLSVEVEIDDEDPVSFDNGSIRFVSSPSVSWSVESPNKISANLAFDLASAHRHYYDMVPVMVSNYTSYQVNSVSSEYIEGSLRVFINGMRLSASVEIYVPGPLVTDPWTAMTYTEDSANGEFTLSTAISEDDVIRIDFDIPLT